MSHTHAHGHGQSHDGSVDTFTVEYWDQRYSSDERVWSGNPNPQLVTYASDLRPGTALEIGSGEGADTIWLAERGWQVTALDVSGVALEKGAEHAAAAGPDVAGRISWEQADMFDWVPDDRRYDLVTAQFMHLPRPSIQRLHRELAKAVAPGGTLLVVGHHPEDVRESPLTDQLDVRYTARDVAAQLDAAEWSSIEPLTLQRDWVDRDGNDAVAHDAVLLAVRIT